MTLKHVDFEVPNFGELASGPVNKPGYRAVVLAMNPRAYWRLGESSGSVAADQTGQHNGSYLGGVTLGEAGAVPFDANTAVRFNGSTGRVLIADVLDFAGTAPFSLLAWAKPTTLTGAAQQVLQKRSNTVGTRNGYVLGLGTSNVWQVARWVSDTANAVSGPTATANTWVHLVGTYTGSQLRLYVNNTAFGPVTSSGSVANVSDPLTLGVNSVQSAAFWNGLIDEVAIFDFALSAAQVAELYRTGVAR